MKRFPEEMGEGIAGQTDQPKSIFIFCYLLPGPWCQQVPPPATALPPPIPPLYICPLVPPSPTISILVSITPSCQLSIYASNHFFSFVLPLLPLPQWFFPSPTTMVASESLLPRVRPPVPLQFVAARETLRARVPICTGKRPIGCPKCSVRIHHSKRVCCPRVPEDGLADGMSSRRFCRKCGKCAVVADPHLCWGGGGRGSFKRVRTWLKYPI